MPQAQPFDINKDMPNHPELSQLIRAIAQADPFVVAEGNDKGVPYVIVGGNDVHFTFTKTDSGYTVKKTK